MFKKIKKYLSTLLILLILVSNLQPALVLAEEPIASPEPIVESVPEPTPTSQDVVIENEAVVVDEVTSESNTGNNAIVLVSPSPSPSPEPLEIPADSSASADIATGDSVALVEVVNVVNTTSVNSELEITNENIIGTQIGDLDLSTIELATSSAQSVEVAIENQAVISNDIQLNANTGENSIDGSGSGLIETGNAYAAGSVVNVVNTNLVDSSLQVVTINIFGHLIGNIILPDLPGGSMSCCSDLLSASNSAVVTNSVTSDSNTGDNTLTSSGGAIHTGQAISAVDIINLINSNFFGGSLYGLTINNYGTWNGSLLGWVEGLEASNTSCEDCVGNTAITNQAMVTNTINSAANTGKNTLTSTADSEIRTGDAYSALSLINIVNTNLSNVVGFIGIINIFGTLDGDIGAARFFEPTPTPEPEASLASEQVNDSNSGEAACPLDGYLEITQVNNVGAYVLPGDTVTFFMTIKNPSSGQVNDAYVDLDLILDGENVGGATYSLGTLAPGKSKKVSTGLVLSSKAFGGNYTAVSRVAGCIGPGKSETSASSESYFTVLGGSVLGSAVDYFDLASDVEASGSVLGASDTQYFAQDRSCGSCIWWQILALQVALLIGIYTFGNPRSKYLLLLSGVVASLGMFGIYYWFNQGCVGEFWGCKWFWLENLGIFLVTTLVFFRKKAVY